VRRFQIKRVACKTPYLFQIDVRFSAQVYTRRRRENNTEVTSQLLVKDEQIKKLKVLLNEAKKEYNTITSDLKKKELYIDEQENIILEYEEKIKDLELQLEDVNVYLIEKTKLVEDLEEKLKQFENIHIQYE